MPSLASLGFMFLELENSFCGEKKQTNKDTRKQAFQANTAGSFTAWTNTQVLEKKEHKSYLFHQPFLASFSCYCIVTTRPLNFLYISQGISMRSPSGLGKEKKKKRS